MPFTLDRAIPRTRNCKFRLDVEEFDAAHSEAALAGLTFSEYVRRRVLGHRVTALVDERLANNLRSVSALAAKIHQESGGAYSKETAALIGEVRAAIEQIARAASR